MIFLFLQKHASQKGQSMLEAVAALGVIAVVMTALTIAVMLGLGNSGYSKKNNLATQYAQQGMELLRNKRETDGAIFWSYSDSYYMDKDNVLSVSTGVNICSSGSVPAASAPIIGGSYIRTVCIKDDSSCGSSTSKKVTVSTWWQDGKCLDNGYCKKASIASCFADLRAPTPTPIPL